MYYQIIRCPNSTTLRILTTVSTSNLVPKIIKNWNVDGKVTLGKLNYRTAVYIVTQYLISHTFPTNCEHCYIFRPNTVIYCVRTPLYIVSEHCYILRPNTVIYCIWTLLYIASEHCYILRLNTVIYCVLTLLYIASEHCYILRLNTVIRVYCVSKNWGKTIFNINKHFTIRTTYVEFQTSTIVLSQENLTSDCKIKQHTWQWKDKKDCSSSSVPSVILIIWMTVTTT